MELKPAVELDGSIHDEPDQKEYDLRRQEYLETFGITFCRVTNDDLMSNANMAFEKIEGFIKKAKQPHPNPSPFKGEGL